MKVKLTGKAIILDIGRISTKFIEVLIKDSVITVLNAGTFNEMEFFITGDGRLKNIKQFAKEMSNAFERFMITSKIVYITSSVLGIKTVTEDYSSKDYQSQKDIQSKVEELHGKKSSNTRISDWQSMGELTADKEIIKRMCVATGELSVMNGIVKAFKDVEYQVQSIEPSSISLSNLAILKEVTFDTPSYMFVELGSETRLQIYKNSVQVYEGILESNIHDISPSLSEVLEIDRETARYLLSYVGFKKPDEEDKTLLKAGLTPDKYYDAVRKVIKESLNELTQTLSDQIQIRELGNTGVVYIGGIADDADFCEVVKDINKGEPIDIFSLSSDILMEKFQIKNQMDVPLRSKYSACIGVCMKNYIEGSINLFPPDMMTIPFFMIANRTLKIIRLGVVAGIAVLMGLIVFNVYNIVVYRNLDTYVLEMEAKLTTIKSQNTRFNNYASGLVQVDTSLTPLIEFLMKYNGGSIRVASVDTEENLRPIVSKMESTVESISEIKEVNYSSNSEDKGAEVKKESKGSKETVVYTKDNIIIRGYSTDSAAITSFFKDLDNCDFTRAVAMNGVKQVTLPSEELLYIFELEVML